MAGNRVEELEAKVRELEATISGLTDELVETKERVRTLEEHVDLELDDIVEGQASRQAAREERVERLQRGGEPESEPAADKPPKQEEVDEAVANADGAADDAKGEEDDGETESGTDDIIVA